MDSSYEWTDENLKFRATEGGVMPLQPASADPRTLGARSGRIILRLAECDQEHQRRMRELARELIGVPEYLPQSWPELLNAARHGRWAADRLAELEGAFWRSEQILVITEERNRLAGRVAELEEQLVREGEARESAEIRVAELETGNSRLLLSDARLTSLRLELAAARTENRRQVEEIARLEKSQKLDLATLTRIFNVNGSLVEDCAKLTAENRMLKAQAEELRDLLTETRVELRRAEPDLRDAIRTGEEQAAKAAEWEARSLEVTRKYVAVGDRLNQWADDLGCNRACDDHAERAEIIRATIEGEPRVDAPAGRCAWPGCVANSFCRSGNFGDLEVCRDHFRITNGGDL